MKCCTPFVLLFESEAITVISYTATMKADYGSMPMVEVYYGETPAGPYIKADTPVLVDMPLTRIEVNHGGISSGYIRISA